LEVIRVNRKAAGRVDAGHLWIFRSDIVGTVDPKLAGETVRVVCGNRTLGVAHYSAASLIALRLLSRRVEETDFAFFKKRVRAAAEFRERVVSGTNAFRLVYAEADGLPALIIDRYADFFVLQALNQGMDRATPLIVRALEELFQPAGILARNDAAVRSQEDLPRETKLLAGVIPEEVAFERNGLTLQADLQHGMKTGGFLDQRENYLAAAKYARGVALDCFTSTGGFALTIAKVCERVEAVDSSQNAIQCARQAAARNQIANVGFIEADVFDALNGYAASRRTFDTIVLDPPAFAKSRDHIQSAAKAYKEINRRALSLLRAGGLLVTCSCSHHMSEAELLNVIAEAAVDTRRNLRVLERRMQAPDHPVLLTVPETLYLKCLILQDTD
jgi:23S rRNA (cytosine1962-C5)-methyltransferase